MTFESNFDNLNNLFELLHDFNLKSKIEEVNEKVRSAYEQNRSQFDGYNEPVLLAVSKTKPDSYIIEAYDNGLRHFGENYVIELIEKAKKLAVRCPEIKWHFIGHLQTNKVVKLLTSVPNLYMIETVDSIKLATSLNLNCLRGNYRDLKILIQINTSGELNKSGVSENDLNPLIDHILKNCPYLKLSGLMTIGQVFETPLPEGHRNPDFIKLIDIRNRICVDFPQIPKNQLILSMGMSNDYVEAISYGSNEVRVGSALFGERVVKK